MSTWCKHYNGMGNHPACKAGVNYRELAAGTSMLELPCIGKWKVKIGAKVCDKCVYPTAAEIAAEEAEDRKRFEEVNRAREAIVERTKGAIAVRGQMPCPICTTGLLSYSVAGSNGHIHAACSTPECVRWME